MRESTFTAAAGMLVLATLAAAMAFRYQVVEPSAIGLACLADGGPWWCGPRALVIAVFGIGALGLLSLGAAIASHFTAGRALALVALAAGAAGLVLYNADAAAAGFVIGLLRALRS